MLRNLARLALVVGAAVAAIASAGSKQQQPAANTYNTTPPPPQNMDPATALGLWKSSFGPVKIESDSRAGQGAIHGVWVYDRQGAEVIGYFGGTLNGNVLQFSWQEPGPDGAPLLGGGYLVFDPYGQRFSGRWWTQSRDRTGEWTGWRQQDGAVEPPPSDDGYEPPPPPG
jgi:hypothetical protein